MALIDSVYWVGLLKVQWFFDIFFLEAFLLGAACVCTTVFDLLFCYHIYITVPIKKKEDFVLYVR